MPVTPQLGPRLWHRRLPQPRPGPSRTRPRWRRPRPGTLVIGALLAVLLVLAPSTAGAAGDLPSPATAPLPGSPVTAFDPPEQDWLPGHRGVDLAGDPGQRIQAAAAGTVSFAGIVAGVSVITVDHGSVRTTYQPVRALVSAGQQVTMGQPIGELEAGHEGCPAEACLHWGLRRGEEYLDPMSLLGGPGDGSAVRLLPAAAMDLARERAEERLRTPPPVSGAPPPAGSGRLQRPSDGPVTSPFGQRLHPVLGVWKLHDGMDFGAPCGAPIWAAADGVVREVYFNSAYGNRLMMDHDLDGRSVRTSYNHAIDFNVNPGDTVRSGQVIGRVGTTGYSTGCHLHFMVWVDGQLVDPALWV